MSNRTSSNSSNKGWPHQFSASLW